MKRITKIETSNFRAFFDSYSIDLPKGENLLIYGENGSGKSSLFKSLSNFLSSSQNTTFPYIKHHSKETSEGNLTFTFNDYDSLSNSITSNFGEVLCFGNEIVSTNTEQFIKTAELTKGFLDYKALLAVYNHNESHPNLFELIIENLFKNFIPTHLGSTEPLGVKFLQLHSKITNANTRNTHDYWDGIPEMAAYETLLRNVLNEVFLQLNTFLIKYFKLNLRVWYSLTPLEATGWWREIPKELRLELKLNGIVVRHQSDFLNEARLSALAICLYLATIKRNPQPIDFKVLFLDDIFIGLDLSNRLPIIDIIKNEFSDYQVFISTYDRHLFELAKRKFDVEAPGRWKTVELYTGKDEINKMPVDRPILVVGEGNYEKGVRYLHDRQNPDYPAAANYFRKSLEELIQTYIPKWETVDSESVQIPNYKLGSLIYKAKKFLAKTSNPTATVDNIIIYLPTLLHPLSHHEIASPIYKTELLIVEKLILKWKNELKYLFESIKYKSTILNSKSAIQIKYTLNPQTNKFFYFILRVNETLVLINNGTDISLSNLHCVIQERWGEENGAKVLNAKYSYSKAEKQQANYNYSSLSEAYDRIYNEISALPGMLAFNKSQNYIDAIEYLDHLGKWQPINNKLVW